MTVAETNATPNAAKAIAHKCEVLGTGGRTAEIVT